MAVGGIHPAFARSIPPGYIGSVSRMRLIMRIAFSPSGTIPDDCFLQVTEEGGVLEDHAQITAAFHLPPLKKSGLWVTPYRHPKAGCSKMTV